MVFITPEITTMQLPTLQTPKGDITGIVLLFLWQKKGDSSFLPMTIFTTIALKTKSAINEVFATWPCYLALFL